VAALSDDIAYNNHDLDDGLRAGLFTEAEARTLPIVARAFDAAAADWPGIEPVRLRFEALRRVFGWMVDDVVAESRRRIEAAAPASAEDIRRLDAPVVAFSEPMLAEIDEMRRFLMRRMYRHWRVARMRVKAGQVVRDLFAAFLANPGLLPDDWAAAARGGDERARARVVADYIAGMTDRFALQEHRVLTDPMARA
jgi:dGTPase